MGQNFKHCRNTQQLHTSGVCLREGVFTAKYTESLERKSQVQRQIRLKNGEICSVMVCFGPIHDLCFFFFCFSFCQIQSRCSMALNLQQNLVRKEASQLVHSLPRPCMKQLLEMRLPSLQKQLLSVTPQQSDICVKFPVSDTQTLENVARGQFHAKFFHDTFGREKRRNCSLRTSAG